MKKILIPIIFLFIAIISAYISMKLVIRGSEIVVPSIKGLSYEQAKTLCESKGLSIKEYEKRYDESIPLNHIISQDPSQGERVKKGRVISVVTSEGSKMVYMPDITSRNLRQANLIMEQCGLKPGMFANVFSEKKDKEEIIAQSPIAGSLIKRGSTVNLLISNGPADVLYCMPDFIGKKINEVKSNLRKAKIAYKIIVADIAEGNEDVIMVQNPLANSSVKQADIIELTISSRGYKKNTFRYANIFFIVPGEVNKSEKRVKITIIDDNGTNEVFNNMCKQGEKIEIGVQVEGEAVANIYINNTIVEERKL